MFVQEVPISIHNELLYVRGDIETNSILINDGTLISDKGYSYQNNGDIILNPTAEVFGKGIFKLNRNLINNGLFLCDSCTIELYGNQNQFIESLTNQTFNLSKIILQGLNSKKSLLNTNLFLLDSLIISNTELALNDNYVRLNNSSEEAVDQTLDKIGFISTDYGGKFMWTCVSNKSYFIPMGSSFENKRRRPLIVNSKNDNTYSFSFYNFSADISNYSLSNTDEKIRKINELFYHTVNSEYDDIFNNELTVFFHSNEDDLFNGLADWKTNIWQPLLPTNTIWNESKSFVNNNSFKFSTVPIPIALTTNYGADFYIPNSFIPDNDGLNDDFEVVFSDGYKIKNVILTIYNRWGEKVFSSTEIPLKWDGSFKGNPVQTGIYTYEFFMERIDRSKVKINGHINLLR
jgi:gliding motility-associated-like protein